MSWHEHHLAHSTSRNTARSADATEQLLDGQRRAELERVGLIDFNAPAAGVRALERRLAIEGGDPVRRVFDLAVLRHLAGWGSAVAVIGLVLAGTVGNAAPVVSGFGGLMLVGGLLSACFGFAEMGPSSVRVSDAEQLADYEAARTR
ncbi:hypothetical protein LQ327_00720 [Actinomycetospora endophytica]|uniref:DUF3040 family protein n=1 Tax=Actinomycetospora endophytica TaxID=2291215 RepID=A0ABS8P0Z2_9PSEU|nr:hypothetical protein [Actinomycetospora endophytica]MCD2191912.1 hypothetical protein [Actinomycetospora endophytica]